MASQFKGSAKMIQVDELRHSAQPLSHFDGSVNFPENDENGFPVYEGSKDFIRHFINASPLRYKLYKSEPMDVQTTNANGALVWEKFFPWEYKKVSRSTGEVDPVTKERMVEWSFDWWEVKPAQKATPEKK